MKYFLSDSDWVYGWKDNQMYLCGKTGAKPISGTPDPMWSVLTEDEAKTYSEKMPL